MKQQWTLIFGLLFALVIAVFSVVNVESVPVDYVFGSAFFPLIVVILGSALAGGFVVGLFGTIRIVRQNRRIRALERELQTAKDAAAALAVQHASDPAPAPTPEAAASAGDDTK
ncbi:MAG TPA: lipopolysaccharide assembly protein LapA domain-containing protein [Paenibacillus sp.]|nr:lipopolysaccharide assembly protein LapA domain-containing protein [Paenibacillus sp.]